MVYIKQYSPDDKEILVAICGEHFEALRNAERQQIIKSATFAEYAKKQTPISILIELIQIFFEGLIKEYGGEEK